MEDQFLREYPGYTLDTLYDEFCDHSEVLGRMTATIQVRIGLENDARGHGKLTAKDIGTKRGEEVSKANAARSQSKMDRTRAFLKKKKRI